MKKYFSMRIHVLKVLYNFFIIHDINIFFSMKNNQTIQGVRNLIQ
jgi:hypothetical protein